MESIVVFVASVFIDTVKKITAGTIQDTTLKTFESLKLAIKHRLSNDDKEVVENIETSANEASQHLELVLRKIDLTKDDDIYRYATQLYQELIDAQNKTVRSITQTQNNPEKSPQIYNENVDTQTFNFD